MPASIATLQKSFKLVMKDDLPAALVEENKDGNWVRCCPLCGCMHKIQGEVSLNAYVPLCQTQSFMFQTQRVAWKKRFPDTAGYSTLNLVYRAN